LNQHEIALARADEAQAYAAAYAVQVRKRELEMADCPCLEHYRKVMQARSLWDQAKRHERVAVSAVTPQRKRKAA
jgi:hypothetical protein